MGDVIIGYKSEGGAVEIQCNWNKATVQELSTAHAQLSLLQVRILDEIKRMGTASEVRK